MSKFIISESEKQRILEMHQNATSRQYLMEADVPADPAWLKTAKDKLAQANGGFLSVGIIKPGATYTQPSDMATSYTHEKSKFAVVAKGAKWNPSPSLTVAYCAAKVYSYDDFGGYNNFDWDSLNNPTVLSQLVAGTYKYKGTAVAGVQSNIVWYPSLSNSVSTAGGMYTHLLLSDDGDAMRTAMKHVEGQPYGPGAGTKYIPGGK